MTYRCRMFSLFAALFAITAPAIAADELDTISLPAPTGAHGVGYSVWHWIDPDRRDGDANAEQRREIMAQLWYPAETTDREPQPYRPLSGGRFNHVRQNAVAAAPFAEGVSSAPLIFLCPGRGTSRHYYSTLAEELASHGFGVLAIDSPRLGFVEFPDGRSVNADPSFKPSFELITGPYEKVDEFFEPAVDLGLGDLQFALKAITALNRKDPAGILTKRLDLSSIGAFGHSLGGRVCGAFAGGEKKVRAYASMEGVPPRGVRRNGIKAHSLMLYSSELPEDLALPNIRELHDNRTAPATILRLEGFGHNSVSDLPLVSPDDFSYAIDPLEGLTTSRSILLKFFIDTLIDDNRFRINPAWSNVTVVEDND